MKPIYLEMRGFGPYGKVASIDFTKLEDRNLFLITGKTGSGKSTIFDAITFALYGAGNTDDKEGKNFKSDFSKEEIETEIIYKFKISNREYTISRKPSQLVKKKRGDGYKSVSEKAYIKYLDYENQKVIKDRLTDVNKFIKDELIYLDIDQFRHITMIPQGQFRKIITSATNERENILRKLFDTTIYMKIQDKLKDEKKQLLDKLKNRKELIDRELGKLDINSEGKLTKDWINYLENQKKDLKIELEKKILDRKELVKEIEKVQKDIIEYGENIKRKLTLEDTKKLLEEHLSNKNKIVELKEKLDKINLAIEFKPDFERLEELKVEKSNIKDNILKKREIQIKLNEELENILIKEYDIKILESSIVDKKIELSKLKDEENNIKSYFENINQITKETEMLVVLERESDNLDENIENTNSKIKSLENILPVNIEYLTERLNNKKENIKNKEENLYELELILKRSDILDMEISLSKEDIKRLKLELNLLEEKVNIEKENFEKLYKSFIENISFILKRDLKEGKPCPVCGSLDHKNRKEEEKTVYIKQEEIEKKRQEILILEKEYLKKKEHLENVARESLLKENEKKLLKNVSRLEVESLKENIFKDTLDYKESKEELEKSITLENNRIKELKKYKSLIEEFELSKRYNNEKVLEKNKILLKLRTLIDKQKFELSKLLDTEDFTFQDYLNRVQTIDIYIKENSRIIENLKEQKESLKNEIQNCNTILEELKKRSEILTLRIEEKDRNLKEKFKNSKFRDEEEYYLFVENLDKISQVEKYIENYNNKKNELEIRIIDLEKNIIEFENFDIEEIRNVEKSLKDKREILEEESNRNSINLEKISECISILTELNLDIEEIEEKYQVIGELSSVANSEIGSINKKNLSFERYILAAFLDRILVATNLRFISITDGRYEIRRRKIIDHKGKQSGLDLEVLDNYTGKIRDITTLSGGESFKASLCMALGLSDTVKANAGGIELDTIFIDEGFGTLDNDSLENAMDILVDIKNTGRLVGIISHVDKLKERIEDKIEIITTREGSEIQDFY